MGIAILLRVLAIPKTLGEYTLQGENDMLSSKQFTDRLDDILTSIINPSLAKTNCVTNLI